MVKQEIKVEIEKMKQRLDTFLCDNLSEYSRAFIQKAVKEGFVLLNGKEAKNSDIVKTNDIVSWQTPPKEELDLKPLNLDLEICYQDDNLAVINKPKGLVVHPASTTKEVTLVHGALAQLDDLSGINGVLRPGIVHRLDKDTSGLIIVAKNDKAHEFLAKQLKAKTLKRDYLALVHGVIDHDFGTIEAPIGRDKNDRRKMTVTEINSKDAITNFKVIRRFKKYTLVECSLETGRTHQIRVHMLFIGFPVVGDDKYGRKKTLETQGQLLHAYRLRFVLPESEIEKTVECELPKQFQEVLNEIEREDNEGK